MRIAAFSDVQGNLPALETVIDHIRAWHPDLVVMNGDLVSRGPSSLACLELFETLREDEGWLPLKGNHEDFVLACADQGPGTGLEGATRRFAVWTLAQLGARVERLRGWPDHLCLQGPDGRWLDFTHGSLAGHRLGISATTPDEALATRVPEGAELFVVAHTHKPMERSFRGTRILNLGSVGTPFDGDPRASYGQLEYRDGRWETRIERLEYDRAGAERDFIDSGFLDQGGPLAPLIFTEWRQARMLMPLLNQRYGEALAAGTMELAEAVGALLAES